MPTVAIASEFLDAFARLPRPQQRKVRQFTEKFKADPTSAAINYEKIHGVRDDKVRTVRIDQKYRAVILHPERGDVHILIWVDNHDEAMDWAKDRSFEINPVTGALQVVSFEEVRRSGDDIPAGLTGLFAAHDDGTLLAFGVPGVLLPAVRAVRTTAELATLGRHLPAEADEALRWLAEGIPAGEIREAMTPPRPAIDPTDLIAALEHPDSRRRFVTIQTDDDLAAMLEAPLEKWRVFLHPSQEKLIARSFGGPARVLGGAGTGKTVVAMHRARYLAAKVFNAPEDRILFTTYASNLADDIDSTLNTLCGPERGRIEVVHLHAWAARRLRSQGDRRDVASGDEIEACWSEALSSSGIRGFDAAFLRKVWDEVIQLNGIDSLDAYLKVPRLGRGKTLSRPQRMDVWLALEGYRKALDRRNRYDWLSLVGQARRSLDAEGQPPYRAVVVDEAQDFHPEEWRLIRALAPRAENDLFLVGDSRQKLYGPRATLSRCGVAIQGRSSRLKINYRTTEQIRAWAMRILEASEVDDLDGGTDDTRGYQSLLVGPDPELHHLGSRGEERDLLTVLVRILVGERPPESICLVARTNSMIRDEYAPMLKNIGIPCQILDRRREKPGGGIRLATMHRVKGLEFPVMILAGINARTMPLRLNSPEDDSAGRSEHEERERSLLFVAATRTRDRLIVTGYGDRSPFLGGGDGST